MRRSRPSERWRIARIAVALVAAMLALTWGCRADAATEMYLGGGCRELLVLERTTDTLRVVRSPMDVYGRYFELGRDVRTQAREADGVLTLTLEVLTPPRGTPPNAWVASSVQVYRRSALFPGDYDQLVDTLLQGRPGTGFASVGAGYLHRVDDGRLIEYFNLAQKKLGEQEAPDSTTSTGSTDGVRMLELARGMAQDHASDAHVRLLLCDALLHNARYTELRGELDAVTTAATARPDDRWLRVPLAMGKSDLAAVALSAQGANAYDLVRSYSAPGVGLEHFLRTLPGMLSMREYRLRYGSLGIEIPNYLQEQVVAKVVRMEATLRLLQGRVGEAETLLFATWRLGQLMSAHRGWIERLIGAAVESVSVGGLELVALNARVGPAEELALLRELVELHSYSPPESGWDIYEVLGVPVADTYANDLPERTTMAETRFRLLCAGVAARYVLLSTLRFPRDEGEFLAVMPRELFVDPFSTAGASLRIRRDPESVAIYSVGPDGTDQYASVEYDPTNGTVSAGDVSLAVPRLVKYPFPKGGVRGATREAVLAQFPAGLPTDVFADTRGRGLGVSASTPVRIYSFGPDCNQGEVDRIEQSGTNAMVQPTLMPSTALPATPTPPIPGLPRGSYFLPPDPLPRSYVPEMMYDPTNGIVSGGDLFMDVSR